ncbi:hypothetical protein M0Q28_05150 [Patescibacteria group bacterium]|nr:hypothetical protein [Patescibacteria group bacterium]
MKRINAMFVLVVALLATALTGCPMGSPPPATGSCPNRGDSMLCTQSNGCEGIQVCGFTSLPGGGHGTDLHWGLCTGPESCAMPVDTGVAMMDGGTTVPDGGTPDDGGMTGSDAGTPPVDAGPTCDPSIVRSCTGACGVPGAIGFLVDSCDPTSPCVRDLTDLTGGCTTVTPSDCPCVGIECSLIVACLTVCDYAGVQTWQDFCLGDACYPIFPESCMPGTDAGMMMSVDAGTDAGPPAMSDAGTDSGPPVMTDAGSDAGPGTMADAGAGAMDAGTDAGPPPVDAGMDSGPPPVDAGSDSGPPVMADAGTDAGRDAGPPACVPTGPEICGNAADEDCSGSAATCPSGVTSSGFDVILSAAGQAMCAPSGVTRCYDSAGDQHDSALGGALHVAASEFASFGHIPTTVICPSQPYTRLYYGLTAAERRALLGQRVTTWDPGITIWLNGVNVTANSWFCWDETYATAHAGSSRSTWDADYIRMTTSLDFPLTGCRSDTGP